MDLNIAAAQAAIEVLAKTFPVRKKTDYERMMSGRKICGNCVKRTCKDRREYVVNCSDFKSWRKK